MRINQFTRRKFLFMPVTRFQLNTKHVFLTYPQCDLSVSGLLARLKELCPNANYYCVSSERHESGELHRHAIMQFAEPFRTRDQRYFDVSNFHPNLQGARNPSKVREYVQKGGDFLEEGIWVDPLERRAKEAVSAEEIEKKASEMQFGAYLAWASVNRVMYAKEIWAAMRHVDVNTIVEYKPDASHINLAFYRLFHAEPPIPKNKAIVIVGASGIGKTVMAKAICLKPALFVSHIDTLKEFKAGYHKSIIFDDVSFKHTPITNQIAICDYEDSRAIHCRHRVAHIPAKVQKIFTCNEDPLEVEHEAIARRIHLIRCSWGHLAKHLAITTINQ